MSISYISLGSNLGDSLTILKQSIIKISELKNTKLIKLSSIYETKPIESNGPNYLNLVIQLETNKKPLKLLEDLQNIELLFGRERQYKNSPRTLDLDVLLFDNLIINLPNLIVPHPRMFKRAFVLYPLNEIASELIDKQMLDKVKNQQIIKTNLELV